MPAPDKSSLRKTCLARRLAIAAQDHNERSLACCKNLARLIESLPPQPRTVAGYVSIKAELAVTPVLLIALAAHKHVTALPCVVPGRKELVFYRSEVGDDLLEDMYGIPVPKGRLEVVPDIVIVPLLAFDRERHRLGYGAGYYDATLAALRAAKPVIAIGAAFALQEVEAIPAEAFDQRLDMVVTEKEVIGSL